MKIEKLYCGWGWNIECGDIDELSQDDINTIGKHLKYGRLVVIKNQPNKTPISLQQFIHKMGDLEGYTKKLQYYDDPNTPEAMNDWKYRIQSVPQRKRYEDYTAAPGVMRVTGETKPRDESSQWLKDSKEYQVSFPQNQPVPTGFFGHNEELDWHVNKPSNPDRHSYVTLYSVYGSEGSRTSWLDNMQSYNDLPQEKKDLYKNVQLTCGHQYGRYSKDHMFVNHINKGLLRPLVVNRYNETGLFFPFHQVFDMTNVDNYEEEWEYLKNHILKEKYMYHHDWDDGDIILSDQDITLHKRWFFKGMNQRLLWRLAHDVSYIKD